MSHRDQVCLLEGGRRGANGGWGAVMWAKFLRVGI